MNSQPSSSKDADYIHWKEWGVNNFANLRAQDRRYFNAELNFFSQKRLSAAQVLEVGFGNGKFLKYSVEAGWQTSGTEINPLLIKIAQENGFNALLSSDLSELEANHFDLVVAFDVLEHIPQDQISFFLNQVCRVLKIGGSCLLRFPNGDSPFGLSNQNGDVTHVRAIGSEKIKYFASQTSLNLICCRGECEPLIEETPLKTLRRIVSFLSKKIINAFIWLVFYKRRNYCSDNLVAILKKANTQGN